MGIASLIPHEFIYFCAAVLAYATIVNRLIALTDGPRNMLAVLGEQILASPKLPKDRASMVRLMLNHAMNGWSMWVIAALVPVAIFVHFFGNAPKTSPVADQKTSQNLGLSMVLFFMVNGAISPIAAIVVLAEVILFAFFVATGRGWSDIAGVVSGIVTAGRLPKRQHA
jgi:hypothetical protein